MNAMSSSSTITIGQALLEDAEDIERLFEGLPGLHDIVINDLADLALPPVGQFWIHMYNISEQRLGVAVIFDGESITLFSLHNFSGQEIDAVSRLWFKDHRENMSEDSLIDAVYTVIGEIRAFCIER
jgi:hypothetical protein